MSREFERWKRQSEQKLDYSKKGSVDSHIVSLVRLINSRPEYFTTSSCSGRVILIDTSSENSDVQKQTVCGSSSLIRNVHLINWLKRWAGPVGMQCWSLNHLFFMFNVVDWRMLSSCTRWPSTLASETPVSLSVKQAKSSRPSVAHTVWRCPWATKAHCWWTMTTFTSCVKSPIRRWRRTSGG